MPKQKALLVDDSKSARFYLRNLLQKNKIEVDMAESGEAALKYLKEHRPDIIFMDHLMPGIDGFETTRSIKSNPETSGIPVVMCTSNEGEEYAQQAKDIGASEILPKPPTEDKLLYILQDISQQAAMAAPAAAAAPAPGMSTLEIETLARTAAQAAVEQALGPMLEELLSSRLEQLRQELQEQGRAQTEELVDAAVSQSSAQLRDAVLGTARQESESLARSAAEQAASRLLEARGEEMQTAARRSAADSIEGFRSDWKAERERLMGEAAQMLAGAKAAAVSAARNAADESARAAAAETATQIASETAIQIARNQTAAAGSGQAQAKLFAGMAALAGILAALVVYFVK